MKYREFIRILIDNGFAIDRERGSHKQYKGLVDGQPRLVTVDYSQPGEDIQIKNFKSMIRQSGLPKKLFR